MTSASPRARRTPTTTRFPIQVRTPSPSTVSINWGAGSFATTFTMSSPGAIAAQSHTYADGPNDYTVSVTVSDKNNASDTKTFSAHVNNVPPTIAISGAASVNEGSTYS